MRMPISWSMQQLSSVCRRCTTAAQLLVSGRGPSVRNALAANTTDGERLQCKFSTAGVRPLALLPNAACVVGACVSLPALCCGALQWHAGAGVEVMCAVVTDESDLY
eukprot:4273608-Pleurochrysis_carterae.AAC.1